MKNHRWLTVVFALVLSILIFVVPVMAATIVIDANWSDWDGVLTLLDSAPDDWNSPQPTDLTEFGAVLEDGSTGGVNIVMAVDNTVMDNQGITQGVTITGANGRYFRFYASAIKTSNADLTPLITDANISLYECVTLVTDNQGNVTSTTPDPTCTDQEVV